MSCMFINVVNFNQAIDEWDTSKVRDICKFSLAPRASIRPLANGTLQMSWNMNYMFNGAVSFKQAICEWDTRRLAGL